VDDFAPIFPIGADFVRILRHLQTVANGKRRLRALHHLLRFIEGVDGERDDIDVLFPEFFDMRLVVG
jgi:hypothetical protein